MEKPARSQSDKFWDVAFDLECDDDPDHFKERLGSLAKQRPVEKPDA